MALIALCVGAPSPNDGIPGILEACSHDWFLVAPEALAEELRERPVSALLVDLESVPGRGAPGWLEGAARSFPSLALAVIASVRDLGALHAVGRSGVDHLLLREECGDGIFARALRAVLADSVAGSVVRAVSPQLARAPLSYVRAALDWVHRTPDADGFARALGWSRPHLSRRLRAAGLPPTGHLLTWSRLLHAGAWLADPGRSGESVSRQLGYANGSTFRRALRHFVGLRPSAVATSGGLRVVLDAFFEATTLPRRLAEPLRVA